MGKPSLSGPLSDRVNYRAYCDAMERRDAADPSNKYYMKCYNFWLKIKKAQKRQKKIKFE